MKLTEYILMMEDGSMKYTTTDKTNKEPEFNGKKVKDRKVRVIPGFHLTLGITVTMLSLIVLIPLASVMVYSLKLSPGEFMALVTKKNVVNAFITSISCSFIAAVINCIFGTILAWTFVKYDFTCKRILDGLIELPFALPTAVAGITLSKLYSETGMPVLEKLDGQYEEAAYILGAGPAKTFFKVILPEISPALLTGFGLAFARGIGEYGSVIYISGNSAKEHTQVVSYVIMQKLNYIDYASATAIALVMLVISFLILLIINIIQMRVAARTS